eukprot:gene4426-4850_t
MKLHGIHLFSIILSLLLFLNNLIILSAWIPLSITNSRILSHTIPRGLIQQQQQQQTHTTTTTTTTTTAVYGSRYYLPPSFYDNAAKGRITSNELEKIFNLNRNDIERILKPHSTGFSGLIFNIETSLIDLTEVYLFAIAFLASMLGKEELPSLSNVRDIIGLPFQDMLIGLGWDYDVDMLEGLAGRFYTVFYNFMDKVELSPIPGASLLLHQAISQGNGVCIMTALPYEVAARALALAGLSPILESRVPLEHFIFNTKLKKREDGLYIAQEVSKLSRSKQYLLACALFQLPPMLVLAFESNRRFVLDSKRMGLNCIALKGNALNVQMLRGADLIISSMEDLPLDDVYKVLKKSVIRSQGPELQTIALGNLRRPSLSLVETPMMKKPKKSKGKLIGGEGGRGRTVSEDMDDLDDDDDDDDEEED